MDEWIGDTAYKLSIAFFDPRILNFTLEDANAGIETLIMGFVNLFQYSEEDPTSTARAGPGGTDVVLAHQIRQKPDGSGMGESFRSQNQVLVVFLWDCNSKPKI